jgi:hypothetical protein
MGQEVTSVNSYTFSDSIEIQAGLLDYCGTKSFTFSIGPAATTELTGSNRGKIIYKPLVTSSSTFGTFKASLLVSLDTATYVTG